MIKARLFGALGLLASVFLIGCGADEDADKGARSTASAEASYPSTYQALSSKLTLIQNATVLTGDGARIEGGCAGSEAGALDVEVDRTREVTGGELLRRTHVEHDDARSRDAGREGPGVHV